MKSNFVRTNSMLMMKAIPVIVWKLFIILYFTTGHFSNACNLPTSSRLKMNAESLSGKYRARQYDKYDEMYAVALRESYACIDPTVREQFDSFTSNLMADPAINRFCLLDALADFQSQYRAIHRQHMMRFNDLAFNYRPY